MSQNFGASPALPVPAVNKENMMMVDLLQTALPQKIVDIDKPKNQKIPKNPSAQSLYNSSVAEETVSAHFSKSPPSQEGSAPRPPAQAATPPTPPTLNDQLALLKDQTKNDKFDRMLSAPKESPSQPVLQNNLSANSGNTDDYLPDYKVGNRTYLNTLANPGIGYYVELRRKFRFAFNPVPSLRNHLNEISRGQIAVVWGVSVDPKGQVAGLTLLRSSGLASYDNEAKRTILSSSPFSSPPSNILTPDGQLHMAWTFVVYL